MHKSRVLFPALLGVACAMVAVPVVHAQTIITQWNFTSAAGAGDNTPAATFGTGSASMLGMTNSFVYNGSASGVGSVASGDVLSTAGVANTSFNEFVWRIRGVKGAGDTGSANNGWNLAAAQYTQGVEFDVSTLGFQNISVGFDWYSTNQGVRTLQEQYTLNGSTWTNINSPLQAVPNDYFGTSSPTNTINFSSISGANNDPSFGIRLVSAFDPSYSGAGSPTYTSATLTAGNPVVYNNNSGNWRFGNITFDGTAVAVPEPGTTGIFTSVFALLVGFYAAVRRSKKAAGEPSPVSAVQ